MLNTPSSKPIRIQTKYSSWLNQPMQAIFPQIFDKAAALGSNYSELLNIYYSSVALVFFKGHWALPMSFPLLRNPLIQVEVSTFQNDATTTNSKKKKKEKKPKDHQKLKIYGI